MIRNIKKFCESCEGGCSVKSNLGKDILSCDKNLQIGADCFTKNKLDLMINPHDELAINTKRSSYVKFMIEYENQLCRMHSMRRNSVNDLLHSPPEFSMEMYKKIDVLFTKMGSWYSRVIITLKKLLISGHYCPNFREFLIATLGDYYRFCEHMLDCDVSTILLEEMTEYVMNMDIPTHNGEYVKTLKDVSKCLTNVYKVLIAQYANDFQIAMNNNVLYYSTDYRSISIEIERRVVEMRVEELLEKFGEFRIGVPNRDELDEQENVEILKSVFLKYKDKITNYDNF